MASLIFAWICANGVVWNVVQVAAWAKMFHGYSQTMPMSQAIALTFDGSAPCGMCNIAQAAQDTARSDLPREAALGSGSEKLVLIADGAPQPILATPDFDWSNLDEEFGITRTKAVPVPPPRA